MQHVDVEFAGFNLALEGVYIEEDPVVWGQTMEDAIEGVPSSYHTAQVTLIRDGKDFYKALCDYVLVQRAVFAGKADPLELKEKYCKLMKLFTEVNVTQIFEELDAYDKLDKLACVQADKAAARNDFVNLGSSYGGSD